MTCREKLKLEHPDLVGDDELGGCHGCPDNWNYASTPAWCAVNNETCRRCWNREVENETETIDEPKPEKKDRVVIVKLNVTAKAVRYSTLVKELTEQLNNGLIVLPPFCELVFVSDGDLKFDIQDGGINEES